MIFETHAHLNSEQYLIDVTEVIKRANESNVSKILDIACGEEELKRSLRLSNEYENIYTAIGVHPVDAKEFTKEKLVYFENLIDNNKKIIAFGEIGLDYHWYPEEKELQAEILIKQLKVAQKKNLPVIIHCRDAHEDCYNILKEFAPINGVVHSFSENYDVAKQFLELGLHIGISGPVTFKNGQNQQDTVEKIDINKLIVETDSPYMTPAPNRGKRNEPANLKYIIKKIADIKNLDIIEVEEKVFENSNKLFKGRK